MPHNKTFEYIFIVFVTECFHPGVPETTVCYHGATAGVVAGWTRAKNRFEVGERARYSSPSFRSN